MTSYNWSSFLSPHPTTAGNNYVNILQCLGGKKTIKLHVALPPFHCIVKRELLLNATPKTAAPSPAEGGCFKTTIRRWLSNKNPRRHQIVWAGSRRQLSTVLLLRARWQQPGEGVGLFSDVVPKQAMRKAMASRGSWPLHSFLFGGSSDGMSLIFDLVPLRRWRAPCQSPYSGHSTICTCRNSLVLVHSVGAIFHP